VDNERAGRKVRILIADDHPIFATGCAGCSNRNRVLKWFAEAQDGEEAVRLTKVHQPDCCCSTLAMPRVKGWARCANSKARVRMRAPSVLTAQIERVDMIAALQLGARGVVLKEAATQTLLKSIRA
jgi:DNA-binding NarL/FixJ family response regulator